MIQKSLAQTMGSSHLKVHTHSPDRIVRLFSHSTAPALKSQMAIPKNVATIHQIPRNMETMDLRPRDWAGTATTLPSLPQ